MKPYLKPHQNNRGFSMIEVLVTLLVFWVGMLGVALFTASGIRNTAVNQVRATVLHAATKSIEPLLYQSRADCLSATLQSFPQRTTTDGGKDTFNIRLVAAMDATGTAIANIASAPAYTVTATASTAWVSPITVVFGVPFTGADGNTVTVYPSYTVPLQKYAGACNA